MRPIVYVTFAALCVLAVPAAGIAAKGGTATTASVRAAVRQGNARWIQAITSADADGIAALFDENGSEVSLRRGTVTTGRDSIRAAFVAYLKDDHPRKAIVTTT